MRSTILPNNFELQTFEPRRKWRKWTEGRTSPLKRLPWCPAKNESKMLFDVCCYGSCCFMKSLMTSLVLIYTLGSCKTARPIEHQWYTRCAWKQGDPKHLNSRETCEYLVFGNFLLYENHYHQLIDVVIGNQNENRCLKCRSTVATV